MSEIFNVYSEGIVLVDPYSMLVGAWILDTQAQEGGRVHRAMHQIATTTEFSPDEIAGMNDLACAEACQLMGVKL